HIADLNFLRGEAQVNALEPDGSKHRFRLRVKCGRREWSSPHFYFIRVPEEASNGHFVVEVIYEGEGTQG
ncbi:hypothetical protein LCGC14_2881480, partial [marine sediment metagenome]